MNVDKVELVLQAHSEVGQSRDVRHAVFVVRGVVKTRRRHVRAAHGFYLLQLVELFFTDDLCKNVRSIAFPVTISNRVGQKAHFYFTNHCHNEVKFNVFECSSLHHQESFNKVELCLRKGGRKRD